MSDEDERTEVAAIEATPGHAELREELEAATRRAEDLADRLKRSQADYENLLKRSARDAEAVREAANDGILGALLPVLDDFDHALAALEGDAAAGVRMLRDNLWKVLAGAGLEAIFPVGEPFDPYDHEVVGQANDEALNDGSVKEVVQTGYWYRRRLLRPAKVIVVKRGV
ncbi:MAG: nucleotide exchange factor GrpE [Candidatus Thermoplasmatota archaeon]